ncbi:hypothetical protein HY994_02620 [Candidatus Micrarchaeota archaeon]|nr:hypothetical protein [Candidatus Micrarchaeota archaeon]
MHPDEAQGQNTGLPDACADRVMMHNVTSLLPDSFHEERKKITGNRSYSDTVYHSGKEDTVWNHLEDFENRLDQSKKDVLAEAFRVLKPGGQLWIGNTSTPSQMHLSHLLEWGQQLGFNAKVVLHDTDYVGFAPSRVRALLSRYMGRIYAGEKAHLWAQFRNAPLDPMWYNEGYYLVRFSKPTPSAPPRRAV